MAHAHEVARERKISASSGLCPLAAAVSIDGIAMT
jgi:hypothetical protein